MRHRATKFRLVRDLVLTTVLTTSCILFCPSSGFAGPPAVTPRTTSIVSPPPPLQLGVPLGALSWALLGLVLLVSGLVAATMSGRRVVNDKNVSPGPTSLQSVRRGGHPGSANLLGDGVFPVGVV